MHDTIAQLLNERPVIIDGAWGTGVCDRVAAAWDRSSGEHVGCMDGSWPFGDLGGATVGGEAVGEGGVGFGGLRLEEGVGDPSARRASGESEGVGSSNEGERWSGTVRSPEVSDDASQHGT